MTPASKHLDKRGVLLEGVRAQATQIEIAADGFSETIHW
jgi:hypothetical protein